MPPRCFSKILAECIQPIIKECPKYIGNAKTKQAWNKSLTFMVKYLLDDIHRSMKKIENKLSLTGNCFKANVINDPTEFVKPSGYNSRFLSEQIRDYIDKTGKYQLMYNCNIQDRKITLVFTLFSEEELSNIADYNDYAKLIYCWLNICNDYSKKECSKTLTIYFYLTPYRKWLPKESTTILGPSHVNSAFSSVCIPNGEIVIFRREEWLKVFIHETFHAFGFDTGLHYSDDIHKKIYSRFPLDIDFKVGEAYTESWARIINCVFYSYVNTIQKKKSKKIFYEYVHASLQMERIYSLYMMQKVLRFMGLKYENLYNTEETDTMLRKNMYREQTGVFGYFILGGIVMNNFYGFMEWCATNNAGFIQFQNTKGNRDKFASFLYKEAKSKILHTTQDCILEHTIESKSKPEMDLFRKTMRMTAIDQMCF